MNQKRNLPFDRSLRRSCLMALWSVCLLMFYRQASGTPSAMSHKTNCLKDTVPSSSWVLHGIVTDENSKPIPGASVKITGVANKGTSTDLSGRFMLEMNNVADSIEISNVGYITQRMLPGGQRNVAITLYIDEVAQKMNEVVVVGYGTQKKITVTGAVSSVSASDMQRAAAPSLSNAIGGRLPGIITRQSSGEPGYDQAQVFIRGQASFSGGNGPLVLIDGVRGRDMNNITAEEIESFTILKDASATAVYGVSGANGVILINTKRGKIGKPLVSLRSEAAQLTALRMPEYIDGYEYASLLNEAQRHAGMENVSYSDEDLQKYADGTDPYLHPNVNWTDVILKKHTYQTIHNLNISGGSEMVRYYTNVGFLMQSGLYKEDGLNKFNTNSNLKRYNFRSNIDVKLSQTFSLTVGLGAIIQNGHYPGTPMPNIFSALGVISPIQYPVKNPDGSVAGGASYLGRNPYALVTQSGYSDQARHTLQSTLAAKWDLSRLVTKGLSVNGRFAYDYYNFSGIDRIRAYEIKQYMGKDPVSEEDKYTVVREGGNLGYAKFVSSNDRGSYIEGSLNYQRTFSSKHDVGGLLLFNQKEDTYLAAPTSILALPYRSRGYAGRATYAYDNRYMAEFNAGINGSEQFPPDKRYGFFPSVSAGWIVSNEKFWNIDWMNQLKIRGSYGKVGNDRITPNNDIRFLYLTTITKDANTAWFGSSQQGYKGYDEGQIGVTDVTWESSFKKNIGFDAELFNMLTLQVDAFSERRKGMLIRRGTIPYVAGYFSWIVPFGNLGESKNHGIDASLKFQNKPAPNQVYFSFMGNFTYAHNKIIENDQPLREGVPYQSARGHSIGAPYGLQAIGLFKDQEEIDQSPVQRFGQVRPGDIRYADVNGDGIINADDYIFLDGHPRDPEIVYGFGGTVAWKGVDLSVFFNGAARTSIFTVGPSVFPFLRGPGSYNILKEYYDNRWTPEHTDARYPAATPENNSNNFQYSSLYLRNAAYLRLKNAEIGYSLPELMMKRYKLKSLRFFINGTNLLTFDKLKFLDPESNNGTNNGLDADNLGRYPLQRSVNFGLQVNF
ncbi:SusC/RagA family TonB-linked outer membrane protein [Niabella drilacis]|uniref:TonB-linked outer membrane protein, SusC/RagA family n=1 Tax=Niabella drilacis (strain DSM 25811 / CCM 8410 / CCUG 62505 / LMG 26954 / E90) TaxID=1285928 RepID=A0A1G6JLK6_NIADE|nr:TonB-dependent receptor [Niabella drilacis]SDC19604.1 TonB-linked outer membrane protein, SusC/RagA family [Niabella drilacis]